MQPLNVHIVTFNCARTLVDSHYFARHLFSLKTSSTHSPDLVVLSLQEIAPIPHSFLGGNLLLPYFRRFIAAVNTATDQHFDAISVRNVGMTAIVVLARTGFSASVREVAFAGAGIGLWRMGNKGAVGVRITIGDEDPALLTFVAAHLAPMEDAVPRRNQDWKDIVTNLVFGPPKPSTSSSGDREPLLSAHGQHGEPLPLQRSMFLRRVPLFFAGDLNYRTRDVGPPPDAYKSFPQPEGNEASRLETNFEALKVTDQLDRERRAGATLHYLDERPVTFAPTYKYAPKHRELWPSDGSEPKMYIWAKHRFPSWCDRILFSSQLSEAQTIFDTYAYDALTLQPTSDHRPVMLSFKIDLQAFASDQALMSNSETPFHINPNYEAERAAARRLEVLVGGLAYLGLTWEGNTLLLASVVGAVGGWLLLRSLIE